MPRVVLTVDVLAAPATAAEQLVGRARVIGGNTKGAMSVGS
jgi:hypothetical protein